jgi:multiple sugar transport system ATP-binding protein
VMKNGVAQQIDTPQRIYDEPVNKFVASFIGSPAMNFLEASVQNHARVLQGTGFELHVSERVSRALMQTGKGRVIAGIRPEHLFPADATNHGDTGFVRGRIELIEPLGSQVMVQVATGEAVVMAQFERREGLEVGAPITLAHKPDTPHAFDLDSERSVLAAQDAENRAALVRAA